ncbi:MAG TPA: hypothetical protein VGB19_00345 [Actinomycetota bacterium]
MGEDKPKQPRRLKDFAADYAKNWRDSTDPLAVKLAKVAKNRTIATFIRGGCCGNHGEPGC